MPPCSDRQSSERLHRAKPYNEKSALDIKDSCQSGRPSSRSVPWRRLTQRPGDGLGRRFRRDGRLRGLAETPTIRRIAINAYGSGTSTPRSVFAHSIVLARQAHCHAQRTASVAKFAYQGSSHVFDRAMVYFASAYADQKQRIMRS